MGLNSVRPGHGSEFSVITSTKERREGDGRREVEERKETYICALLVALKK